MSRRGENIYKRKDGRWEGRYIKNYTADNRAKYGYVYGKTYSDVKEKLISAKAVPIRSTPECKLKTISLNEVLTLWLLSVQRNVKEATYARYHHLVEAHIRPKMGAYAVDQITPTVIENYINELLSHGRLDVSNNHIGLLYHPLVSPRDSEARMYRFQSLWIKGFHCVISGPVLLGSRHIGQYNIIGNMRVFFFQQTKRMQNGTVEPTLVAHQERIDTFFYQLIQNWK